MKHLICFIEHKHRDAAQAQRLAAHVIEQSSRRSDNQMPAAFQLAQLLLHILPAVYGQDLDIALLGQLARFLCNLKRQLPRRSKDQRLRKRPLRPDFIENRQQECQCLPRSRLRSCNHVQSLDQRRNRLRLHGSRLCNALPPKNPGQLFRNPQLFKSWHSYHLLLSCVVTFHPT
ncbi:hypothetical protein D3C75_122320 [compost metagenome]